MLYKQYLFHHGIKGQKWGVWNNETRIRYAGGKRNLKSFGTENIKNAKISNLDKFGKDKDHNVLYITGLSGSGKSTVAESLRDNNTNIIHLDFYLESGNNRNSVANRDPEFSDYLRKKVPDYYKHYNGELPLISKLNLSEKQKVWKMLDDFADAIDSFGQEQFSKNKSVVVEGVQLADDTLYPIKEVFKDKPMMIISTDSDTATKRGNERDGITEQDIETLAIRKKWQDFWDVELANLSTTVDAKQGSEIVQDILDRL